MQEYSHEQMLQSIIQHYLGYKGNHYPEIPLEDDGYPDVTLVNETPPKFAVGPPQDHINESTWYSEIFKVRFYVSSRDSLQTVKNNLEGLKTNVPGGYIPNGKSFTTEKLTIKSYLDDISFEVDTSGNTILNTYSGVEGYTWNTINTMKCTFLKFKGEDFSLPVPPESVFSSATLYITPKSTVSNPPGSYTFTLYGINLELNPSEITDFNTWNNAKTTAHSNPSWSWNLDVENSTSVLSIMNELSSASKDYLFYFSYQTGSALNFVTYTKDSSNSNPTKYACIQMTYTLPENFPFWIDILSEKIDFDKNHWTIDLEFEMRFNL